MMIDDVIDPSMIESISSFINHHSSIIVHQ